MLSILKKRTKKNLSIFSSMLSKKHLKISDLSNLAIKKSSPVGYYASKLFLLYYNNLLLYIFLPT